MVPSEEKRPVVILGSTGSIGRQALDVVRSRPNRLYVSALSASSNATLLQRQAAEFKPDYVALENGDPAELADLDSEVLTGSGSAARLAELPDSIVLNAIVGFAGLAATVNALYTGNTLALANKESLVTGGEWVMGLASSGRIIPVDSEHSAIFQCLECGGDVSEILLTASGGPFFGSSLEELKGAGPEDALKHPTWDMGKKITIDSATMMNKGLEVLEAHHLFDVPFERVRVVVHRQSMVHGGAIFEDSSTMMHAAVPDMRIPISYALLHPEKLDAGAEGVGFSGEHWTFEEPRHDTFRCLPLAVEAGKAGGAYPVALNAANEIAVDAFLDKRIEFLQIADTIEGVLESLPNTGPMHSLEAIQHADRTAREKALEMING
jgi:1-deoxy-D-xylulose-5-phosphate reductoisomerase